LDQHRPAGDDRKRGAVGKPRRRFYHAIMKGSTRYAAGAAFSISHILRRLSA
jgi:hypothetical protein